MPDPEFKLNTAEDFNELRDFMTNCVLIQTRFIASLKTLTVEYEKAVAQSVVSSKFDMVKGTGITGLRDAWGLIGLVDEPDATNFATRLKYTNFATDRPDDAYVKAQVERAMMTYFFGVALNNQQVNHNANVAGVDAAALAVRRVLLEVVGPPVTYVSADASRVNVGIKDGLAPPPMEGFKPQALLNFIYFTPSQTAGGGGGGAGKSISNLLLDKINLLPGSLRHDVAKYIGNINPIMNVFPFNGNIFPNGPGAQFPTNADPNLTAAGNVGVIIP